MKEQKLDEQMAVTYDNEKAFKDLFARVCDNKTIKNKGNLYTIMSVAQELGATEFCMLCIQQCLSQQVLNHVYYFWMNVTLLLSPVTIKTMWARFRD